MSDVTFGVKVSEEMKLELSQIMKEHALSGKEFMSMLLASYRLDKAKEETKFFESDIIELQNLTKRIQSIFLNMTEKSMLNYREEQQALEKVIEAQQLEKEAVIKEQEKLKEILEDAKKREHDMHQKELALQKANDEFAKEVLTLKRQLENNMLLHKKFEEEVGQLNEKIDGYKRLEVEIEERNEENTKLKSRNDEMASEMWFLQREVEKLQKEKEQLNEKYETEKMHIATQFELKLKNELLEQRLGLLEEINNLKKQVTELKEAKNAIEKTYYSKIEDLYKNLEEDAEKK